MKIAYLVHQALLRYSGGGHIHVMELTRAFERLGHEVVLVASNTGELLAREAVTQAGVGGEPAGGGTKRLLRRVAGERLWQRLRGWRHSSRARAAVQPLALALQQQGVAAVYERYSLYNTAGIHAAARLGLPHVLEVNSLIETLIEYGDHTPDPAADRAEREIFSATRAVVAVSDAVRQAVVRAGVSNDKVQVLPNGVDLERFHPGLSGREFLEANGLWGRTIIGMVAYFKRWHGLDQLLCVAPEVVEACPDVRFLLVGEGDRPGAVSDYVHAQGLSALVSVTGRVDHAEIPKHVAAMDITVIPHFHRHGSPLKLYEYMAAGKPTVAVAVGQITETIEDGVTGLLVPLDDAVALRDALIRLAQDAALRERMGRASRVQAQERHSWDGVAARIVELL